MKIVSYNPAEVQNIPAMMNRQIAESTDDFIMFIFDKLLEQMVDKEKACSEYQTFMQKFNLPFMMFPYYMHFNKIMHGYLSKPNPRAVVHIKKTGEVFDVIGTASYGMLIVNKKRLASIEFRFDERFPKAFYIQDIMYNCFKKGIWMSSTYLIDIHDSWKMFKDTEKGYVIDGPVFAKEREEFMKTHEDQPQAINDFIGLLKSNYGA